MSSTLKAALPPKVGGSFPLSPIRELDLIEDRLAYKAFSAEDNKSLVCLIRLLFLLSLSKERRNSLVYRSPQHRGHSIDFFGTSSKSEPESSLPRFPYRFD